MSKKESNVPLTDFDEVYDWDFLKNPCWGVYFWTTLISQDWHYILKAKINF